MWSLRSGYLKAIVIAVEKFFNLKYDCHIELPFFSVCYITNQLKDLSAAAAETVVQQLPVLNVTDALTDVPRGKQPCYKTKYALLLYTFHNVFDLPRLGDG